MLVPSRILREARRLLVLVGMVLFAAVPALDAGRTILAALDAADRGAACGTSGDFEEDEEIAEAALVTRSDVEVTAPVTKRAPSILVASADLRHRMEGEMDRLGRIWGKYRAPPRGPPLRLLN